MKNLFSVMAGALLVGGCAMPINDQLNNNFVEISPEPVRSGLVGLWTGSSGPYLLTVRLEQDGRGIYCSSWNEKNTLGNVKFSAEHLYFQDGSSMDLNQQGENLTGKARYSGAHYVRFKRDPDLTEAAPYCKASLPLS